MNTEIKGIDVNFLNESDRAHIKDFAQEALPNYTEELDLLIASVQADTCVQAENSKHLKRINDSIIKEIETRSRSMSDSRAIKILGKVFRDARPEYYYASGIMGMIVKVLSTSLESDLAIYLFDTDRGKYILRASDRYMQGVTTRRNQND